MGKILKIAQRTAVSGGAIVALALQVPPHQAASNAALWVQTITGHLPNWPHQIDSWLTAACVALVALPVVSWNKRRRDFNRLIAEDAKRMMGGRNIDGLAMGTAEWKPTEAEIREECAALGKPRVEPYLSEARDSLIFGRHFEEFSGQAPKPTIGSHNANLPLYLVLASILLIGAALFYRIHQPLPVASLAIEQAAPVALSSPGAGAAKSANATKIAKAPGQIVTKKTVPARITEPNPPQRASAAIILENVTGFTMENGTVRGFDNPIDAANSADIRFSNTYLERAPNGR